LDFGEFEDEDDIFAAPSQSKSPRRGLSIIEDDDIFSALPKSKASNRIPEQTVDDLFSTPSKSKSSERKNEKTNDEVILSITSDPKSSREDLVKDEDLFIVPSKATSSNRNQGKTKSKPKKMLDDDLFGDDFDLFSDIPAKSNTKVCQPGLTKNQKPEISQNLATNKGYMIWLCALDLQYIYIQSPSLFLYFLKSIRASSLSGAVPAN
jgi:hypothetical protein